MRRFALLIALAISVLLVVLAFIYIDEEELVTCTQEAKICPDGSYVGRVGPNCEFEKCPDVEEDSCFGFSEVECSKRSECEPIYGSSACSEDETICTADVVFKRCREKVRTFCEDSQRGDIVCTAEYNPACGWSDPGKIQCVTYPCAQTYSNSCVACSDENVLYWTEGECPKA